MNRFQKLVWGWPLWIGLRKLRINIKKIVDGLYHIETGLVYFYDKK